MKQELEKTLTMGSFIDLKKLANKVNPQKQFISDGETRIKSLQSSASVTNMSAYLNKCQCNNPLQQESGLFNCDLHKSSNKSNLSQLSINLGINNYSTL